MRSGTRLRGRDVHDLGGPGDPGYRVLTDDELTELALATEPGPPGADAIPIAEFLGQLPGPLPDWYMPRSTARIGGRWRTPVVLAIVAAFLVIDAFGLCNTYGWLTLA